MFMEVEHNEVRNLSEALSVVGESISGFQGNVESVDAALSGPTLKKGKRLLQEALEFASDLDATLREIRFLPAPSSTASSRLASVDDVFRAFDAAIDRWVDSKIDGLIEAYGPEEAADMAGILADWIYKDIELDQAHMDRFVKFYVDDVKLADALDEFLTGFALDASKVAFALSTVASGIDASTTPDPRAVTRDLGAILSLLPPRTARSGPGSKGQKAEWIRELETIRDSAGHAAQRLRSDVLNESDLEAVDMAMNVMETALKDVYREFLDEFESLT